ncbi:hypothetical protein M406DRAFT_354904 [Cryphonectria parasitica EP155]|uniref:Uncharacterized protein n=1 Tax=Cryphonectria parasitica (strain ATCC 38755 / EP155) TaxID=660469 RepID=A0A9P4Y9G7_CRYP1|nr:uncharacterized protein M406DRAFT_354904 [Cryphonectria parasitica EP155]KAF3768510.1 hypothetical protein M406DRAFT_354904 [Cryphonectria parasitica EP155]
MASPPSPLSAKAEQPPQVQMKVIGVGLPRCATTSLKSALEGPLLDCGPCMHMRSMVWQPNKMQLVINAMRERDTNRRHAILYRLFEGCASTVDVPGTLFADDLMDMYPDAAVLLNTRPGPEEHRAASWSRSCHEVFGFPYSLLFRCIYFPFRTLRKVSTMLQGIYDYWAQQPRFAELGLQPGAGAGLDWASPEFYERYQIWVKEQAARRGRHLIEYHPGMGWEPLCEMVGRLDKVPPPGTKLPHENDAKSMKTRMRVLVVSGAVAWAAIFGSAWMLVRYGPMAFRRVHLVSFPSSR